MRKTALETARLSIVIPLFNESELLKSDIPRFVRWLEKSSPNSEVIIVENGSTDGSDSLSDRLEQKYRAVRVLHLPFPSFGSAVQVGLLAAKSPISILLNADWLDRQFVQRVPAAIQGNALVVGSKALAGSDDQRPLLRKLTSQLLTRVLRKRFGYAGSDTHGLKAFRSELMKPIVACCRSNEALESELLIRTVRAKLKIKEIPVAIAEIRPPRISLSKRALRVARELHRLHKVLKSSKPVPGLHIDDAGYHEASLAALKKLVVARRVDSLSVMVNGAVVEELVGFLKALPEAERPALFLHFNIVEGPSLTPSESLPVLTDGLGNFQSKEHVIWQSLRGKLTVEEVRRELDSQLSAFGSYGLELAGIDSHQHMHALAPVAAAVLAAGKTRGVKIRSYRMFRTVSGYGKLKLSLYKMTARCTQLRLSRKWKLPRSWHIRSWRPFVVASWERAGRHNAPEGAVIVSHPLCDCDQLDEQ